MEIFKTLLIENPSSGGGGGGTWGSITGVLSNQTDLQNALNAKANTSSLGSLAFLSSINNGNWSGTQLALANGGTGATTQSGAANAILPSQSTNNGKYLTTDGTNVSWGTISTGVAWGSITGTLSSQTDLQNALNAKASLSGATFTGTITSTLGTLTTSTPALDMSQTWNAAAVNFTALKLNVTQGGSGSGSGSLLADLQVGGVSVLQIDKQGRLLYESGGGWQGFGFIGQGRAGIGYSNSTVYLFHNSITAAGYTASVWNFDPAYNLGWGSSGAGTSQDTGLRRNAAGVVEINNGTAGTFRDLTLRSLLPASGTITADTPLISGTQTWNNSGVNFTAFKINVTQGASGSGAYSLLFDVQMGGTSYMNLSKNGELQVNTFQSLSGATLTFRLDTIGPVNRFYNGGNSFAYGVLDLGSGYKNTATTSIVGGDGNEGAGIVAIRGGQNSSVGTNPNKFRVYNTWTSSTNYERLGLNWATNVAQIYTEKGSGGGTARDLVLGTNATTAITISGTDQSVTTSGALSDSIGNVRSIPQNAQTAAYVLAATDNGKHVSITTGGVTVNSGIFSVGQVVTIYNNSSSAQTITQGTSVTMYQAGTTNTGNRTLASYGVATVLCVASNTFVITGSGLS